MMKVLKLSFLLLTMLLTQIHAYASFDESRSIVNVELRTDESTDAPISREVELYNSSYALVIGMDEYSNGWPRLSNAVKDARLVAKEMERRGFEVTFKKNLNSSALKEAFNEFFIFKGENPQSRLFVWFAGHGHTHNGEGYLIPSDAPNPAGSAKFRYKALSMRRFGEYVRLAQSKHVYTVFDSCFSGTIFSTERSKPPIAITKYTTEPVRQFLSSGDADQPVSDDGRFRSLFIRALNGEENADANGDDYLTGSELGLFLSDRLTNLSGARQTPRYGKLRDEKYDRGDFVFLLASSAATIDTPVETGGKSLLTVSADVSGAKVYVDGRYMGRTPLERIKISPGSHRVRVEKDGFQPYEREISTSLGWKKALKALLIPQGPALGRLTVQAMPENATIKILNIVPKFTQGMVLSPGKYHVEVSADKHTTRSEWVTLSAGEDKKLEICLDPSLLSDTLSEKSFTNSLGMEFVYIKPGTFMMGSPETEPGRSDNESLYEVTLSKGYYLQATEVTQGQWQALMNNNPSHFKTCGEECPVENVSWNDVQKFIQKLNQREDKYKYRLPTEAEWEYAARAGTTSVFGIENTFESDYGGSLSTDKANFNGDYTFNISFTEGIYRKKTIAVKSFPPNPWGLYDMQGNVGEWCQDWHSDYPTGSVTDPSGPSSGVDRVCRGGGYNAPDILCRSASRGSYEPDTRDDGLAFRLTITLLSKVP